MVEAKYGSKTYLVRLKGGGIWKRHADQIMKDLSLRELPQEPQREEAKQEVTPSRDKDEAGSQQGRGKESFQTNPPQEGLGTASNPETEVEDRAHSRGTKTIPEGKQAEGEVEEETESSGCTITTTKTNKEWKGSKETKQIYRQLKGEKYDVCMYANRWVYCVTQ